MKTIKPQKLSVLHRVFEHRGRKLFVPTVIVTFPLDHPDVLLHEVVLWKSVASELGEGAVLDEMMFKPRAEALLCGHAYPPGGEPAITCSARMQVGVVDKSVVVVGDRHWTTLGSSQPVPFASMPLDWSRAFGGENYAPNPLGRGAESVAEEGKMRQPLPNLELPGQLIKSPTERPQPISFSAIPYPWPQRQRLAGTYDSAWRKKRYPGFADDIDLAMFNVAQPDQRFDGYLQGGEPFLLENVHPERQRWQGRLPTHRARCFVTRRGGKGEREGKGEQVPPLEEIALQRDTIHFFPEVGCGVLIFRGVLVVEEDDAADLLHLVAAAEAAGAPKPLDHYQDALARRLDRDTGGLAALKESELLPEEPPERVPLAIERYGDMAELLETDGLLEKNQRRGAEQQIDQARQACQEAGLDPDKIFPKPAPEPQKVTDLENLDTLVDELMAERDKVVAEAESKREQLRAKADEALAEAGIDDDLSQGTGGPPTFSAEAQLTSLRQQIALLQIAGQPVDKLQAQLADEAWIGQLREAEERLVEAYRRFAHYYPPAAADPEQAARLRDELQRAAAAGESLARRDLSCADLSGLDLRGADLSEAYLEGVDLSGAQLDEANLNNVVLARAIVRNTSLRGANLSGANLGGAQLAGCDLQGCDARDAVFARAQLSQVQLDGVQLDGASFLEARFERTSLRGARGHRLLFLRLDMSEVDLSESTLTECVFIETTLDRARFDKATLTRTIFVACQALQARFDGARAHNLRICKDSRFVESSFAGAQLDGAAFRGTDLQQADLSGASLAGADLSACLLQQANLTRVVAPKVMMMKADLRRAQLIEANLMEGILQKANIRGTDFRGANLFRVDFARIDGDESTRFDGALRKHVRFVRPEGGMG